MAASSDRVASLSLADRERDPDAFARALGQSFAAHGFAILSDHGIPPDTVARAEAAARAFFALPEAVKRPYHAVNGGGARGYTPFAVETAKGASLSDLKEFWHVGRELPVDHPFRAVMPDNVWPAEVPAFREATLALYDAFERTGRRVLAAIARDLGLGDDWFDDSVRDGDSVLRLLHYPPIGADAPGTRAGAHEDINTITLLLGAEEAGLQLLTRDGTWLDVGPRPGELVVNVGDMLQRLTADAMRSTTHRVCNPAPERRGCARHAMPFFLHFRPDFLIEPLPQCARAGGAREAPITAHAFLRERLKEIRLI